MVNGVAGMSLVTTILIGNMEAVPIAMHSDAYGPTFTTTITSISFAKSNFTWIL